MYLNEYLMTRLHPAKPLPHIKCSDGLTISIQASAYCYCTPQSSKGPWTHVECGYPSQAIPELMEYAEDEDDPTRTVYKFVPVELVQQVINQHGGMSNEKPRSARGGADHAVTPRGKTDGKS